MRASELLSDRHWRTPPAAHRMVTYKMIRLQVTFVLVVALGFMSGCVSSSRSNMDFSLPTNVKVVALGPIEEELLPSSPLPVLTSFVWVRVVAPTEAIADRRKLVLAQFRSFAPGRPAAGGIWRSPGNEVDVRVILNRMSGVLFLDPPLAVEKHQ